MHAAVITDASSPVFSSHEPGPSASPEELVVDVAACALNPVDLLIADGGHPTILPAKPYVPGFEVVGWVWDDDDQRRVWGLSGIGGLAEHVAIDRKNLVDVPDGLSDQVAVAVGIAGIAAWMSLVDRGKLIEGDRVLILGASGAVGRLALQIARLLGAERVVAVARSWRDDLFEAGADELVLIEKNEDLGERLRRIEPKGFDLILDPIFGVPGQAAIEVAAEGGRIVVIGALAGPSVRLSTAIFDRGLSIFGHRNSAASADDRRRAYLAVAGHAAAGRIQVPYREFKLHDIAAAWRMQAASPGSKVVIKMDFFDGYE